MGKTARRALMRLLFLSIAVSAVHAQDAPVTDGDQSDSVPEVSNSVLELSKAEEIIELLANSYGTALALKVAVQSAECTRAEPGCAPLFFAQDVILGPWNFVKLLRVIQELPDPDITTIFQPRDYRTLAVAPAGVLPAEMVALAEYALEQQVALYKYLEAWQVTLERYSAALGSNNEAAAAAQRRALDTYSSEASSAAAGVNAAASHFLEDLTPLMRHFGPVISVEDAEAAKVDLQGQGFGPELKERFTALGIGQADSDRLLAEIFAVSDAAPVDLFDGLSAVVGGYDRLADLTTVPADAAGNLRPLADAGPDQLVPTADAGFASVVLNGARSRDPEAGVLEYVWSGASVKASGVTPTITLPLGTHFIALTVADGKGGTDVDLVAVTVADVAAPRITRLTARPDVLSPSNRQLVPVEIDVKVVDNDDPMPFCQVVSVGVNEPASDTGGATSEPDIVFDGSLTLLLRAERSGDKASRVYSVTVQCTDEKNHSSLGSVFVSVPR